MSVFKLPGTAIQANTITTTQLTTTVVNQISAGGGPRVSSLIYPGNDTAGNTVGGQTVYINGSGFETNNAIYINGNAVPSKSFISASNLSFTTPALSAGIYPVYVINTDNSATAIFVPGYISSAEPTWVTGASLSDIASTDAWSISLSATGDAPITYALANGSSLPSGITLAANGLISGTMSSPPESETQYTFTVVASDAQNQDASRQFTVSVSTGEGLLFANNVLLIHSDGTNNQNNHTFLDSSNNNFTITRNGNATQGSFSPFSQTGWSVYFDGDGDFLDAGYNSNFTFGSGNFTIECWVHTQATGTIAGIWDDVSTNPQSWIISSANRGSTTAANINFVIDIAGADTQLMSALQPMNKWFHLAITRSGSSWYMFMDGVQVATATSSATINAGDGSRGLNLGAYNGANQSHKWGMQGYISNFRINKGTALYTSAFTPANSALTAVSGTTLLTCQSNRFIDNSSNNYGLTRNGNISIQAFSPFAPTAAYSTANVGGSVYLDGTGDYLTVADNTALDMGSSDFTIQGWYYPNGNTTNYPALFSKRADGSVVGGVLVYFAQTPTLLPSLLVDIGGSWAINTQSSIPFIAYQWNHFAVVRNGSAFNLYINGVSGVSATNAGTIPDNSSAFAIGAMGANGAVPINSCYISNFRVVKGTAVYTSAFTPPTAPVTNIANTSLLCNFTNAGIFDQTAKNVLETLGDAKVSTAQYKYGTGSMSFDGTGDYLIAPSKICDFGTGNFTVEGWIRVSNTTGAKFIADSRSTGSDAGFGLLLEDSTGYKLRVYRNGGYLITSSSTISSNTWYHVAFVRNNSNSFLYIDGTQVANSSDTNSYIQAGSFRIGAGWNNGDFFNGYIDDLRITKGYARYTSNFTAPTAALKDK